MEQENIIWKEMPTSPMPNKHEKIRGEIEPCKMDSYPSLYLELRDKCNPKNFMVPYNKEKVDEANNLFKELLSTDEKDKEKLRDIRDRGAAGMLGIKFSTKLLYENLLEYCNPEKFINPYHFESIQIGNKYYSLVNEYRNDIRMLEKLEIEIYQNETLSGYYNRIREEEKEKEKEKDNHNFLNYLFFLILCGIIFFFLILVLSQQN